MKPSIPMTDPGIPGATRLLRTLLVALALAGTAQVHAETDFFDGDLRLSGFGTLALARTTSDAALFNGFGQADGASRSWSEMPDSKLALQARYRLSPEFSLTAQVLSRLTVDSNYKPSLEWAYARWAPTRALSLRLGRMGSPFYMVSDSRDVGTANLQVRPPLDVYGQVPVRHFDGGDASYQFGLGPVTMTASLWGGRASSRFVLLRVPAGAEQGRIRLDGILGVNITADAGEGWSLRLGHVRTKLSSVYIGADPFAAFLPAGESGVPIAPGDQTPARFSGIGVAYDKGDWIFSAEYTRRDAAALVPSTMGWYVMGGFRVGALTPYLGLSRQSVRGDRMVNPFADYLTFPGLPGVLAGLTQRSFDALVNEQSTVTLGVRWDALPTVSVKAQIDHVNKPAGSYGSFVPSKGEDPFDRTFFLRKCAINVISFSVDFVY